MYEDKNDEELLALYETACQTAVKANAGFGQPVKTITEAREDLTQIRQELLRRLQAYELARAKLNQFLELASEIDNDPHT